MVSGDIVVVIKNDGATSVLGAHDLTPMRRLHLGGGDEPNFRGPVVASADGRVLIAAPEGFRYSGEIVLSVAGSAEGVAQVADHVVVSLALIADGDLLLTSSDRLIRLRHVPTGRLLTQLECNQDIGAIAMSADGCAIPAVVGTFHIRCRELDWDYGAFVRHTD
ncbi:hypothetical protein [Amycolatopsis sp. FDAARGOS 1241]|uniref:hypothetical protein n=1 Tax=Amycolatopsis sp. FDAARGOS 1241 TaxID=2778070 RepID=UPI00194F59DA|nr:hypothetical protein [Amycolatopsis sp. FDAARGOS 1241]QRP48586.1 hypothetical protein I6J71_12535 [Amycolatopsis sp. FDAARGOS 1241]